MRNGWYVRVPLALFKLDPMSQGPSAECYRERHTQRPDFDGINRTDLPTRCVRIRRPSTKQRREEWGRNWAKKKRGFLVVTSLWRNDGRKEVKERTRKEMSHQQCIESWTRPCIEILEWDIRGHLSWLSLCVIFTSRWYSLVTGALVT